MCTCHEELEILGTGGYARKGKTTWGKYYDAYWCNKCKRMYIDCHFHNRFGKEKRFGQSHVIHYSPKATREHLKHLMRCNHDQ